MEVDVEPSKAPGLPSRLGLAEFLTLPEDGKRYEVLDGDLCVSPSPNTKHQRVTLRLASLLLDQLERRKRGFVFVAPLDVVLGPHDIVEPDVIYVGKEHRSIIGKERITGAPDLLVEVLSGSTRTRDRRLKALRYARAGVSTYWILDPVRDTLEVYKVRDNAYALEVTARSPASYRTKDFGGLEIDLGELFADPT